MGTTGNTHTGGGAPERAMAERIAVTRTRAISNALEAGACFDEAGESYWESEFKAGRKSIFKPQWNLQDGVTTLLNVRVKVYSKHPRWI